jgi:hypothetical protein
MPALQYSYPFMYISPLIHIYANQSLQPIYIHTPKYLVFHSQHNCQLISLPIATLDLIEMTLPMTIQFLNIMTPSYTQSLLQNPPETFNSLNILSVTSFLIEILPN